MALTNMAMKPTYIKDRRLEAKFQKIIKAILGNYFIRQDINVDQQEGTDFAVFEVRPFRVAVRLRRYAYFVKYKDEFTIRWSRPSGVKTEYHKIIDGLVDYILYGFIDEEESKIIAYFIGDLNIFRIIMPKPISIIPNNPYDSKLAVFNIRQLPKDFIIYRYPGSKS